MEAIARAVPVVPVATSTVRAIVQSGYGGTEVLRVGERARPTPGPREVLVSVAAAGMDRGTWHMMTGRPYLMRIMGFGFRGPNEPVPGLDLSGVVVEVGPGVTRFAVGDRVFGLGRGSFAELTVAHEDKLSRAPTSLPLEEAAVLGVSGMTAHQAVAAAKVQRGESVLIVGASGGVGTYAVQIAKALGAVVTAVCSGEKAEVVRGLGADVIDYRTTDFTKSERRFDVILDVGGATPVRAMRRVMTERGRLVFVGAEGVSDWTAGMGRLLTGVLFGLFSKQRFIPLANREHHDSLDAVRALVEAGQVRPVVDRRIGLSEVPAALADLEAGRVLGKVLVRAA